MPRIDYTCPQGCHRFERIVLRGEEISPASRPRCQTLQVKPSRGPASLLDGIARLNTDTN